MQPIENKATWFSHPRLLESFVLDLIVHELNGLRPGLSPLKPVEYASTLRLDSGELAADSLEVLGVWSALSTAIHLQHSEVVDNFHDNLQLGHWLSITQKSLACYCEKITFKTSGSRGLAKPCTHQLSHLTQEAAALAALLNTLANNDANDLTRRHKRILRAVPAHHIYGFIFCVLLPNELTQQFGTEVKVLDIRLCSPNFVHSILQAGDLVIGFPEFWQSMRDAKRTFAHGVHGVNSTAKLEEQISLDLLALGLSSMLEVYGSSETAGVAWRMHPSLPYRLFDYWEKTSSALGLQRRPPAFVSSQVDAAHPISTAAPAQPAGIEKSRDVELQDELEWVSARQFFIKGRRDDMVQVGGINVSLSKVHAVIADHPLVQAVAVRLMRPEEGKRLKIMVVPAKTQEKLAESALREQLESYINQHLSAPERPKSISIATALAKTSSGKDADW